MTRVVVGYGRTGRSVARFFEERALPFWVADDHLDPEAKTGLGALQHCEGCSTLAELSPASGQTWIVSPGIPLTHPVFERAIDQGVQLINDLHLFAREVSGLLVGVTGSNGKSTVVAMVDHIAKAHQIRSIAAGNIGLPVLETLDQSLELTVIELSSYQLELDPVIDFHVGALVNLMPDHLDRYPSVDAYYKTKEKLLRASNKVVCFDAWRAERAEQALHAQAQDWVWVGQARDGETIRSVLKRAWRWLMLAKSIASFTAMQKEKFRNKVFGFVDTIVRMQRRRWVLRCAWACPSSHPLRLCSRSQVWLIDARWSRQRTG